jgi:outer membrane protein assembly factor BamB
VVQRLRGASGEVIWTQELEGTGPLASDWRSYIGATNRDVPLVTVGSDLVWASSLTATLLCQSGRTGELCWRHSASGPPVPRLPPVGGVPATGGVCGLPKAVDIGGDRGPGVIALFWVDQAPHYRLRAVSADRGQLVWECPLAGSPSDHQNAYRPEPALGLVRGRQVVVCVVGDQFHGVDVQTGRPAWPARRLAYRVLGPPRLADLDGDGNTDALLLHEDEPFRLTLTALDLAGGRVLWESTWSGVPEPRIDKHTDLVRPHQAQDWPLVVDLDGDGRPEVVVRLAEFSPSYHLPVRAPRETGPDPVVETVGVRVLDGATGRERWVRRLARSRSDQCAVLFPFRLLAGEVGEKGGPAQLIVASLVVRWKSGLYCCGELYVDALSGPDGSSRWGWSLPLDDSKITHLGGFGLSKLGWWKAGPRGQPLLLVPLRVSLGWAYRDTRATYLLDGETGELLHTAPDLEDPRPADLDGDGRPELLGWTTRWKRERTWQPIRGTVPALLAYTQRWKPAKRTVNVLGQGSREEEEPEPVLPPPQPVEDHRGEVPLPWQRYWLLGESGEVNFVVEFLPRLFVVLVPFLLVLIPLTIWGETAHKRRQRQQGTTEAELTARSGRWMRWSLAHGAAGLLLVLATAAVWIALDTERRPDERYNTSVWYFEGIVAWALASVVLMGLTQGIRLVRKGVIGVRRRLLA